MRVTRPAGRTAFESLLWYNEWRMIANDRGAENMAVREGFEPSVPFDRYGALAKRCFRPLSHLTTGSREYVEESVVANDD